MARKPSTLDELTDSIRRHWDQQAPRYDRSMSRIERFFLGDSRAWICSRARGRTLEVACGTGLNLSLYPDDLELTGIDLSPGMLAIARKRAADLGREVDLREADAQRLPFDDDAFDTVVCTLSLCGVPDERAAVAEMWRVLRPGGQLLLLDHIRPSAAPVRWGLQVLQALVNVTMPGSGEQFLRRPLETVTAQGFAVEQRDRFKAGAIERLVARKPA